MSKPSEFDPAKQVLWARPGYLTRRVNQIHYALFFEACPSADITPVQYGILTVLALMPGIDQKTIGLELGLDRTNTADVVKRLESKGLVERFVNPVNRRSWQVFITRKGLDTMSHLQAGMFRAQERLVAPLNQKDKAVF